ncbi:hypothetical protein HYX58_03860 [Candidatus Dependentiae bacterium]|nr:hypothetical protein [Candidatus Dependentiae bacterium]
MIRRSMLVAIFIIANINIQLNAVRVGADSSSAKTIEQEQPAGEDIKGKLETHVLKHVSTKVFFSAPQASTSNIEKKIIIKEEKK